MFKLLLSLIVGATIFAGCSSQPKPNSQPSWVINPNQGGKLGAVGSANRVYDGKRSTKRKLAITRALDELSLQQGVKVSVSMTKSEKVTNDRASTSFNTDSDYKADATITAHIEDSWENRLTKELFIWMVMD